MAGKQKLDLQAFLETHPVFRLDEFAQARSAPDLLSAARNQLKHHLRRGRVKRWRARCTPWCRSAIQLCGL
jgi:hypothetical protein